MLGTPMTPGTGLMPQSPLTPGVPYEDSKYACFYHLIFKERVVLLKSLASTLYVNDSGHLIGY